MSSVIRLACLAAAVAFAGATACSNDGPSAPTPNAPNFAKSGTAPSGGGGGGSVGVDSTGGGGGGGGGGTTQSGLSGSSFTARVDSISNVPMTTYYAAPSTWGVGGYVFESTWDTRLKSTAAPFAVGVCLTVTFSTNGLGAHIASDIRTEVPSKCP